MSDAEETVAEIIRAADRLRLDSEGGYPSDWKIANGRVYWATVGGWAGAPNEPRLVVRDVDDFIDEYSFHLEELGP